MRIEVPGGRYHLTVRGNERRNIFRDPRDRQHFLGLLGALPARFGTILHAFVLMPNHYHLLLETPEANLSRTGQWLNVSYSVWFNRRHQRHGHLFQGRFGAVIIEDDANFQEVGRYLHLNPVRVTGLGLGKVARAAGKMGLSAAPSAGVVAQRLEVLRNWQWSSYPAYAGYATAPEWLSQEVLGSMCGGRTRKERQKALRTYTEKAVREGLPERPWERVLGGSVLGTATFAGKLRQGLKIDQREHAGSQQMKSKVSWAQIVRAVSQVKGETWELFRDRHGDWGRDAALWLGRRAGRLRLTELAELAGGLDYTTVGAAVSRFHRRWPQDAQLTKMMQKIQTQLSIIEI
ncbi:MAG: transposase [Pyrinomonadaceae bacterium]|nr:transposase [Phycisphaerales bacterium]